MSPDGVDLRLEKEQELFTEGDSICMSRHGCFHDFLLRIEFGHGAEMVSK